MVDKLKLQLLRRVPLFAGLPDADLIGIAMTREMGKVLNETRGDVQEGIDTAYYAASEGRRLFGHTHAVSCPGGAGHHLQSLGIDIQARLADQLSPGTVAP